MTKLRAKYHSLAPPDLKAGDAFSDAAWPNEYDRVQLKYDGQWASLEIVDCEYTLRSRSGRVLKSGLLDIPLGVDSTWALKSSTLVGEWMPPQSVWAQKHGLVGTFHAFDILSSSPFDERMEELDVAFWELVAAGEGWVWQIETFKASCWFRLWKNHILPNADEGLVFKKSTGLFGEPVARMKREITVDLVCMGFNYNKKDEVRSIRAGVYVNQELTEVCSVPVLLKQQKKDLAKRGRSFVGRVFEVTGNGVFPSGAVRHPRFNRWRPEKEAHECIFNNGEGDKND